MTFRLILGVFFLSWATLSQAKDPHPLFADDEIINVTLTAPFKPLVRKAERSPDPYDATISVGGNINESAAIYLSARGNSRRTKDLCSFPPLRIEFIEKPEKNSYFKGQKRLKLVTHCKNSERFQQFYLLEYAAYRLYNLVTPVSLRVRQAKVDYIEAESGELVVSRYGFLIEDTDDAAKRNALKEIDAPDIALNQVDDTAAGQYAVFQYMISNFDWSLHEGPDGKDCCHNTKLVGAEKTSSTDLLPIPYDFDYSGLVDSPYAIPPESVSVRSVTRRRYRGFCIHNAEAIAAAAAMRGREAEFLAVFDDVAGLSERNRDKAKRFVGEFFEHIEDNEAVEKKLLRHCRK